MDEDNIEPTDNEDLSTQLDNDSKSVNIGSGVRIDGRIEGAETSDVSGTLTGTLKSSNININSKGTFSGDMSGQEITISGNVDGEINSEDYLIVNDSADIKGVIEYASLQVSYGARIQGTLRHRGTVKSYSPVSTDEIKEDEISEDQEVDQ
jgi:cytoskeletal protein CcmA (bactofilin family)